MAAKRRKGIGSRRHFNRDRRENLESYLNARVKVAECARLLRVSRKSVYHEIRMGMEAKEGSAVECPYRRGHYVCNGCPKKDSGCAYGRVYYNADLADERAERLKHEANEGTRMSLSEFTDVKERIRDGVKRRISPEVICRGNGEEPRLPVSSSTVRRWIRERRIEGLCDIFLPRAKRYRKAYSRPKTASYDKLRMIKGGHRMSDFLDYVAEHPDAVLIEADSVVGIQTDTRRILTIMFLREHFQYGTVYRTATAAKSVADEFSRLLEAFHAQGPRKARRRPRGQRIRVRRNHPAGEEVQGPEGVLHVALQGDGQAALRAQPRGAQETHTEGDVVQESDPGGSHLHVLVHQLAGRRKP